MKQYKLYLFDFDGTLFDSFGALDYVFDSAFSAVGVQIDHDRVDVYSRRPLEETYAELNAPLDKLNIFIAEIIRALDDKRSIKATKTFHDTLDFLKYCKNHSIKIGIVTSNSVLHVKNILNYFNIPEDTFCVYVGSDMEKSTKPSPKPILKALEILNYQDSLDDVIYVGDAENDCLAGKNANIDYILINRSNKPYLGPYRSIDSLLDLFK